MIATREKESKTVKRGHDTVYGVQRTNTKC